MSKGLRAGWQDLGGLDLLVHPKRSISSEFDDFKGSTCYGI